MIPFFIYSFVSPLQCTTFEIEESNTRAHTRSKRFTVGRPSPFPQPNTTPRRPDGFDGMVTRIARFTGLDDDDDESASRRPSKSRWSGYLD